jgi:uncharacterized membrane protein
MLKPINKRIYFNISELNLLLLLASVFSCGLVVARVLWTLTPVYTSLIWNLFLAWIPYIISYKTKQNGALIHKPLKLALLFGAWIAFYPNAPYIITDLFHLNQRPGAPLWFDLVLLVSFAWNGAILGLLSLKDMQVLVAKRYTERKGWWFAIIALLLSGFGVYLGRYLRWNSWDIVAQTQMLTSDLWFILSKPMQNAQAYGFTILFAAFQIFIYYSFWRFINMLKTGRGAV